MSWVLLTVLTLFLTTPARAWAQKPTTLTPARRAEILLCQRTPSQCPPGTKVPSTAEAQALASEQTAERLMHSTCADLLPEVRALWDKDAAGQALTYDERMVWETWKVVCQKRPSSLGPRP
jgi:hypothetical protein